MGGKKKSEKNESFHGSNQSIDSSMTIPIQTLLIKDIQIQFTLYPLELGVEGVSSFFLDYHRDPI